MSEDGEVPASPVTRRRADARGRRRGRYPSSDSDSEEGVERSQSDSNSDEASGEEEEQDGRLSPHLTTSTQRWTRTRWTSC